MASSFSSSSSSSTNYPLPHPSTLAPQFVGKKITDIPTTPAVILDAALLRRNCAAMLAACEGLGVGFRPHVKSHKTLELSKMQVGETGSANFIVSTVVEAEKLSEFVGECQAKGREASLLYGVPCPLSAIPRLLALAEKLAPESINIIVDNEEAFVKIHERIATCKSTAQLGFFIKIDTGYHRAGIETSSAHFSRLVTTVLDKTRDGGRFVGFYSHGGHSYGGNSIDDAAKGLIEELIGLEAAARAVSSHNKIGKLVLSAGATPTATVAQNMLIGSSDPGKQQLRDILARLQKEYQVELHAGVYPLLDCQQVATRARPCEGPGTKTFQSLSKDDIAIRMLVEVNSVYNERAKPEALIAAGSLALGREPCKSYPGWGIVTRSLANAQTHSIYDENGEKTGWIVGRISQEHGILTWEGKREECNPLSIGDKLLIWPNHACVAGAGFGWYLVVDSEQDENVISDVWVRWRGW